MLNENQRRRLDVRFRRLLAEGQQLLEQLPGDLRELREELSETLEAARRAAARLELPTETERSSPVHRLRFWAATWRSRMLDAGPEGLRGYGALSDDEGDRVAVEVEELARRLARLERLAESDSREGGAEEGE